MCIGVHVYVCVASRLFWIPVYISFGVEVGHTSLGHTGELATSFTPSIWYFSAPFCGACHNFYLKKVFTVQFPRQFHLSNHVEFRNKCS